MYHDLGLKCTSPTVNLFFCPEDFFNIIIAWIGRLGDIRIHFLHYSSFQKAKIMWNKRKQKIRFSSFFYIRVLKKHVWEML